MHKPVTSYAVVFVIPPWIVDFQTEDSFLPFCHHLDFGRAGIGPLLEPADNLASANLLCDIGSCIEFFLTQYLQYKVEIFISRIATAQQRRLFCVYRRMMKRELAFEK